MVFREGFSFIKGDICIWFFGYSVVYNEESLWFRLVVGVRVFLFRFVFLVFVVFGLVWFI